MSQTRETTNGNAAMTPGRLLTPVSTLNAWRALEIELPYVHTGRLLRYPPEDVAHLIRRNIDRNEFDTPARHPNGRVRRTHNQVHTQILKQHVQLP
ncbi:hypothetical protein BACT_0707 [Bifidobacterium actinocoloniiforme DSM 22766]|uniref:Uncharacterized protein n=1 Tax=Bifidobacterium actinocoloniiforme DSM 22766 TaxID=1437605 RepID=A0A086Z0F5_9BIFI|nr:hypothetical protein AB656_02140 [Bifidobacterium actinocoloniiforme DSM 22766]KFI40005.1 hypothetical protein BACT_0707 [Bifidobacterium actinocoloniiforme DSM 22766]